MERLTYDFAVDGQHCWQVKGADNALCKEVCRDQGDNGCENCPIAKAIDRLAAYEDIGTPEEFLAFMNTGMTPDEYAKAVKDLASALATDSVFRHQFEPDRAREIITAETEDRLQVLPCAPGNIVWALERDRKGNVVDFSGYMFLAQTRGSVIVTPFVNDMEDVRDTLDYLEKDTRRNHYADLAVFPARDIYLTREEAEEKLREDNNEKTQSV